MNPWISKLAEVAQKKVRLIIGLMSGTSLDGLDVALCKISGSGLSTQAEVLAFETFEYTPFFKQQIQQICFVKNVDLEKVCLLNAHIARVHAEYILTFIKSNNLKATEIDLIASHGQTIYHSPKRLRPKDDFPNATLQIGDADHLATLTGIVTLADFRQKNIAQGLEGAPLALYGDYLLFANSAEKRILLNIGGIANFTCLDSDVNFQDILCTDTGPGNTLMNQYMSKYFDKDYDKDAEIAKKGLINQNLLNELLNHPFFSYQLPKTTGPELFNLTYLETAIKNVGLNDLTKEDVMATLNKFTAVSVANAIQQSIHDLSKAVIYISGGGAHNPLLVENLISLLPNTPVKKMEELGVSADAKEALLFAVLANETVAGNYQVFGEGTLSLGKLSLPI